MNFKFLQLCKTDRYVNATGKLELYKVFKCVYSFNHRIEDKNKNGKAFRLHDQLSYQFNYLSETPTNSSFFYVFKTCMLLISFTELT